MTETFTSIAAPVVEARPAAIVALIPDAAVAVDRRGRVLAANPHAASLFGYPQAELVGLPVLALMPERFRGSHASHVAAFWKDPSRRPMGRGLEIVVLRSDGVEVPVDISLMPLIAAGEECTIAAFHDLSEHKRDQQELRESEERFRALAEYSPDTIAVHQAGVLRYLNPAGMDLLGATGPGHVLGRNVFEFIHPDDLPSVAAAAGQADSGPPALVEGRLQRLDGSWIWVELCSSPTNVGGLPATQTTVRNITLRRALEEQLRQSQKLNAVGSLAGGVAHDFNNLLTIILGCVEEARTHAADRPELAVELDEIVNAATRAAGLTAKLLALGQRQLLQPRVVDLVDHVRQFLPLLSHLVGPTVGIRHAFGEDPAYALVDPSQIEQVLMNLATNAREAMPTGGELAVSVAGLRTSAPMVAHGAELPAGAYVRLAVSDTGKGIAAALLDRIFEPFVTTKDVGQGQGLGLAVVHGAVAQSGGFISVDTEPARGTTFTIYLPRVDHPAGSAAAV